MEMTTENTYHLGWGCFEGFFRIFLNELIYKTLHLCFQKATVEKTCKESLKMERKGNKLTRRHAAFQYLEMRNR